MSSSRDEFTHKKENSKTYVSLATFVPLKGTTTWRHHDTKPSKFGRNVFPRTSHMNYRTGLVLGEAFCISIF